MRNQKKTTMDEQNFKKCNKTCNDSVLTNATVLL